MIEYRWRNEPPLVILRPAQTFPSAKQLRLFLSQFNVFQIRFHLRLIHRRPHFHSRLESIAHRILLSPLDKLLEKYVGNFLFNHHAAVSRTALPGRSKRRSEEHTSELQSPV